MTAPKPPETPEEILAREFPPEQIGKLPRVTCYDCREAPSKCCGNHRKERCSVCNGYLTNAHIHLDYVGHAAVTKRLLEADFEWSWRFFTPEELTSVPPNWREKGIWIQLTVAGVTRPGFGNAEGRQDPEAPKIAIGDALRNAAMRFGVALDLWSKEDLRGQQADIEQTHDEETATDKPAGKKAAAKKTTSKRAAAARQSRSKAQEAPGATKAAKASQSSSEPADEAALPELPRPERIPTAHRPWYIGWTAELAAAKSRTEVERLGAELRDNPAASDLSTPTITAITTHLRARWRQLPPPEEA